MRCIRIILCAIAFMVVIDCGKSKEGTKTEQFSEEGFLPRIERVYWTDLDKVLFKPTRRYYALSATVSDSESDLIRETIANSTRVDVRQLGKLVGDYINGATKIWKVAAASIKNIPKFVQQDPYETSKDYDKRIADTLSARLEHLRNSLREYYDDWQPKTVTSINDPSTIDKRSTIFRVGYDADLQYVFVVDEVSRVIGGPTLVKHSDVESGYVKYIMAAAPFSMKISNSPLLKRKLERIDRNLTINYAGSIFGIAVPMSIERAKSLDIENNRGVLETTWEFLSCNTKVETFDNMRFPVLHLLSARWIVDNDTLWQCGAGKLGMMFKDLAIEETLGKFVY